MASQRGMNARGVGTQAGRTFTVQQAFAELGRATASMGDLISVTGLDLSTVSRVVQSGINYGIFLRLEPGVYSLAAAVERGVCSLPKTASQELHALQRATDQGLVFLYLKSPFGLTSRHCIDMAIGGFDLTALGTTRKDLLSITHSLRLGAPGRAILAYLPERTQEVVASTALPLAAGPGALHDQDVFRSAVADVRDTGYAVGFEECRQGWHSIAAPVFLGDAVMGSVLVLMPADAMPDPSPEIVAAIQITAARLSRPER
ncbi:IclR family transcriptional regulator (plasmid) [Actinacidiphila glaucinigra]|uniref:IclR family transcriptional regulator domain-containing protein n=1 Tax=Actinacidiphila glaucinigra TaxID=235986 RepID=UPI002DDBF150|nr:IclR family transcriptional regulator C-terminal domain-containing protein [Actinacidiphila glaucinigra]WSD65896.1 IclR family transcriptional regulator [Actinacidiphila glaucinigra]